MVLYIIKIVLSAVIITVVSEISKRSSLFGGLVASLPLTSLLAIIWLYIDTRNIEKIQSLSVSIFWLVLPSLVFFVTLPVLLKRLSFTLSLLCSSCITITAYYVMIALLRHFKVKF